MKKKVRVVVLVSCSNCLSMAWDTVLCPPSKCEKKDDDDDDDGDD